MPKKEKKNIVVFLLDTVRNSAVSELRLSNIGRAARKGIRYNNTISPGTWTGPSHASLFTNRRVSRISGVSKDFFRNGTYKIDPWMVKTKFLNQNEETLARKVSMLGYQSTLFSNNPFLTSFTNLGTGFDTIYDMWMHSNIKYNKSLVDKVAFIVNGGASARIKMYKTSYAFTRMLPPKYLDMLYMYLRQKLNESISKADGTHMLDRGAKETNAELKRHLEYRYNYKPQFMFLNYMEAHENYPVRPEEKLIQDKWLYLSGLVELDDDKKKSLYSAYIRRIVYLDGQVGKALHILKTHGILDNATVVITSDHGQFFGEHGLLYHSLPPYEEVSKVPLIAANYENGKIVGTKEEIGTNVSLTALHQSLFNLASSKYDYLNGDLKRDKYTFSEHSGISEGWDEGLLRLLKPRSKSAESIYKAKERHNIKVTAVYNGNMKLMHYFGRKTDELYDLSSDPAESNNIIASNRGLANEMARAIFKY